MNGDSNDPPAGGPQDEARTVFIPSSGAPPAPTPPPSPIPSPAPTSAAPSTSPGTSHSGFAPRTDGKGIQVGDVLNHIFEVKRFIARGGMGEVFEGINVNTDEPVAIKVMLPALAADPNVISMFRKEARTLTRLQHEALVQYRVLAQEPQLGVLYIVTDYIAGTNLADVLGQLRPSPADLLLLLRRLASGLRAAHMLGAIHRDISPDNVLLEEGRLDRAKVIDFGIAKDLDPGSATIVGDGFAGKLNYVAPEQLGDFGRAIGPWTDVYSLALVIMAVASGRNVQMGGSLVDAVDKRRAGPDLSAMPDEIRPVLEKMLKPNPVDRLQSMDAVIAELDAKPAPPPAAPITKPARPRNNRNLLIGGGAAGVLALAVAGWAMLGGGPDKGGTAGQTVGANGSAGGGDSVALARSIVDSTLPSVGCTWLRIVDVTGSDRGPLVKLTGVAGNPAAAQREIGRALAMQKIEGANIDFEEVSPITQSGCAALDTYRQIRVPDSNRLSVPQRKFEFRMQPPSAGFPSINAANTIIEMNIGDPSKDFTLIGVEPSGKIDPIIVSRADLERKRGEPGWRITDLGGDRYRLELVVDHIGWSGPLLLTGKGPFDPKIVAPQLGSRGPDWREAFVSAAAAQGWQADMVWFKTVDEVREDGTAMIGLAVPPPPSTTTTAPARATTRPAATRPRPVARPPAACKTAACANARFGIPLDIDGRPVSVAPAPASVDPCAGKGARCRDRRTRSTGEGDAPSPAAKPSQGY